MDRGAAHGVEMSRARLSDQHLLISEGGSRAATGGPPASLEAHGRESRTFCGLPDTPSRPFHKYSKLPGFFRSLLLTYHGQEILPSSPIPSFCGSPSDETQCFFYCAKILS